MLFEFDKMDFDCNDIHEGLINQGEVVCFMCHKQITDIETLCMRNDLCQECNSAMLIDDNGIIVCTSCGYVTDYHNVLDVTFYDSHHIKKRSIYRSKYYIQKALNQFSKKHQLQVPIQIRLLICEVIELIRSSEELMQGRKRIISINYIIRQIFKRAGLPYKFIPLSRSRTTRKKYRAFWKQVMKSDIGNIIRRDCY